MSDITIFTETSEEKGLLYNSYMFLNDRISSFLDIIGNAISKIKRDPLTDLSYIRKEIDTFKDDISIEYSPEAINISDIKQNKKEITNFRADIENLLNRYSKLRYSITAGGNYVHGIIMKSKLYSKDIDPEHYDIINTNIRNIFRALDWTEKVLIDLLNMIDQDLNLLTLIQTTYGRKRIFEYDDRSLVSKELMNSKLEINGEIRKVTNNDVLSKYFLDWFLKNDDWKNTDSDSIDYDIFSNNDKNFVYGYYINNQIEGLIRIIKMAEDRYEINMLYINPNIHNRGIGTKLMKYVIDIFGKYTMEVSVFVDNPNAVHLYEKFGFKTKHTIHITKDNCGKDTEFIGRTWYLKERPADKKSINESSELLEDKLYFATSSKLDSETISVKAPRGLILYQTIRTATLNGINKDSIAKEYFESILAKNHKEIYSPKYTVIYGPITQDNGNKNEPLTSINIFHNVPSYKELGSGITHLYIYSVDVSKIKYELSFIEDGWLYQGQTKLPIHLIDECDTKWTITYSNTIGTIGKIEIKDMKESSDIFSTEINSDNIDIRKCDINILDDKYFNNWIQTYDEFKDANWDIFKTDHEIYGLFINDKIEYILILNHYLDKDYAAFDIFYGNPKILNKGIGQKLFEYVVNLYRNEWICLDVRKTNPRAIHIYKKYGFKEEKYEPWEYDDTYSFKLVRKPDTKNIITESGYGNVRRYLYNEFIEYAKGIRKKNTFESNYEDDLFTKKFLFIPYEMQFFYRVANPILCVLNDNLCFFQLSELKHLNDDGFSDTDKTLIFAADLNQMIVFNMENKKIYSGTEINKELVLGDVLADSFDKYIQQLIGRDDIL